MFKSNIQKKFNKHLSSKKLRLTGQRQIILDAFLNSEHHISIEELFLTVLRKDPSIGQATVYRMVRLMCEAGIATRVDFGDGMFRYEPQDDVDSHQHLICRKCQKNIEIDDQAIIAGLERIAEAHNFSFDRHKLYIYGLCSVCRKK